MTNPYAVTTVMPVAPSDSTSMMRGIAFGLAGYFAPILILFLLCCLSFGWLAVGQNFDRFVAIHSTVSLNSLLAMVPNLICLILFAIAGYRVRSRRGAARVWLTPMGLGLLTLLGYCLVMLTTTVVFPLPWRWSAEQANGTRAGLVALFPLAGIGYRVIRAKRPAS